MTDVWRIFGITIIVLIAIVSLILIFAYLSRECNTTLDCSEEEYCAYNHKCIPYLSNNQEYNLFFSSLVIGISIIIAAFVLRKRYNFRFKKR